MSKIDKETRKTLEIVILALALFAIIGILGSIVAWMMYNSASVGSLSATMTAIP